MSSNEVLLNNININSNNYVSPRKNGVRDILASILSSDHDLKVMLSDATSDSCEDEGSFIFVTRCDNGQILFVSSAINNILNISQEEWLNINLFTHIHPGDKDKVKDQLIISNPEIDGGFDGNSDNNARKNDEVMKGNAVADAVCNDIGAVMAAGGNQDKSANRRSFSCRLRCRPKVISTQHSTVVNNNDNGGSHSANGSSINRDTTLTNSNKESTLPRQNSNIFENMSESNNNYLTVQCNGLIRKWPLSLITKVNDEPNELHQPQQQLNEDEPQYVHCLIATATMKQQITQTPSPAISKLNQLNLQQFHHRLLPPTQMLPPSTSSTSIMTNTYNRIKQFTTRHTINGNFIYVDQRITEALGYNTAELLDKCFFDNFYHDDCKFIKETFKFIPSLKGKPMTVTYRYWSKVVSYWVWLRIVIYTNNNNSNRGLAVPCINYIVCDCTVLPNEVTAENINNRQSIRSVTSGGCVTSSTNRKHFNCHYSNRFNQHQHVQYNTNTINHKSVMQYNKDLMLHRHLYHKQQQVDNLASLHTDQPHLLTDNLFATNNGYLNNDQSSICQPFQLPTSPLTASLQRNHQHQPRTLTPSSQLDVYNNMLHIDSYITGRGAGGLLSEESALIAPTAAPSNWNTAQISNTFPSALAEWSIPSAGEFLPPTSATTTAANWSFIFNNGVNKSNGNGWSSYVTSGNSNTDLNSVEQQLEFWATLDDVNATAPIWPHSDNCTNNDALVYNCNNQQLSNTLLPANTDINSFRQKSNWLTENVENFDNLSQFLYNNDNSINAASARESNLTRSNIYNELLSSSVTCTTEQENQSNFYTELDIANIWSQMEREQQMQLQQFIISDNYGCGNSNCFDDLGLSNLTMPAQSQTVGAIIGGANKNVEDEQWKLNEEMVNNIYNMTTRIGTTVNAKSTGSSSSSSPPISPSTTLIKTTPLLYNVNNSNTSVHGPQQQQQQEQLDSSNTIILPPSLQQQNSPRSSPPGNNSNILSRLPDLIEQVLHVDQTYNKHIITSTTTTTTTTTTLNNVDNNPIITQPIKTTHANTNNIITSTPSSI